MVEVNPVPLINRIARGVDAAHNYAWLDAADRLLSQEYFEITRQREEWPNMFVPPCLPTSTSSGERMCHHYQQPTTYPSQP